MSKTNKPANTIETIFEGRPDKAAIAQALSAYSQGLLEFAYPPNLEKSTMFAGMDSKALKAILKHHIQRANQEALEIILEINQRAQAITAKDFLDLAARDTALWQKPNSPQSEFGVLACVDKGIPFEAVIGVKGTLGRTLAGDINISFSQTENSFFADEQIIVKRLIHLSRQGIRLFIEPLIEHTNCGRRGQLLANESNHASLPSLGYIFEHVSALTAEFRLKLSAPKAFTDTISSIWTSYARTARSVQTPDGGLWAGTIVKIAQRQALQRLRKRATFVFPIEVYDKSNGNLITGVDSPQALTDPVVKQEGGFTAKALDKLSQNNTIFSLGKYWPTIVSLLQKQGLQKGVLNYKELQSNWLSSQAQLLHVTEKLWRLWEEKESVLITLSNHYLRLVLTQIKDSIPQNMDLLVRRRLIHHLFHVVSYAFSLDTLGRGNEPGVKHIEDHLAIGDHEAGSKTHLALGQGDLDDPLASEMFTGYSVLLHSKPGADGLPIPVMIKLDTDRPGTLALSTEETRVAMTDFREFLKLWPYFLAGDLIPYLVIRSKAMGGISRLALSVVLTLNDIVRLSEQRNKSLPQFVPAVNSSGEVVLVPARNILEEAIASGDNLGIFRQTLKTVADRYSNIHFQEAFLAHEKLEA